MLPERKKLAWLPAVPESVTMAACIAEGRLAPANGRNPGCQSGPSSSSCLLFRGPKNGPKPSPKNVAAILPEEGKASNMAAPFSGTRGGDSGTFRLFSWQWAWESLIQVSQYIYIYTYIYIYISFRHTQNHLKLVIYSSYAH